MVSGLIGQLPVAVAPGLSVVILWLGLSVAGVCAMTRGAPAGLLRFRPGDIVWGLSAGALLRVIQGVLSDANSLPFPRPLGGVGWGQRLGGVPVEVLLGLGAPIVEEFFFRGVLLVTVYQLSRRSLGYRGASALSLSVSVFGFVILHLFFDSMSLTEVVEIVLVGTACSVCTLATGRIWGAVLIHLVYNASFFALISVGSL